MFTLMSAGTLSVKPMLEGAQTSLLTAAGEALPVAGAVFAAIAGVMLGFKFFKKITGARG